MNEERLTRQFIGWTLIERKPKGEASTNMRNGNKENYVGKERW